MKSWGTELDAEALRQVPVYVAGDEEDQVGEAARDLVHYIQAMREEVGPSILTRWSCRPWVRKEESTC